MRRLLVTLGLMAFAGTAAAQTPAPNPRGTFNQSWMAPFDPTTGEIYTRANPMPTASAATPTGTNNVGSVTGNQGYTDMTANVAASATIQSTARAVPPWASYFGCRATSNTSGTLYVSTYDGTNYLSVAIQAFSNATADLTVRVRGGSGSLYYCVYVNGATATTTFSLASSFTAN